MAKSSVNELTQLLKAWRQGDAAAGAELFELVFQDLRRIARRQMAQERVGHTLSPTALVNETYLRLAESTNISWQDRTHFFAICAQIMRRVLVDWAPSRKTDKRGGDLQVIEIQDLKNLTVEASADILTLDEALKELAVFDQRKARVVELRFFGGLETKEIAELLEVSPETVARDWRLAKSWLRREMDQNKADES